MHFAPLAWPMRRPSKLAVAVAALLVQRQIFHPVCSLVLYFQSFVVKCVGSSREDLAVPSFFLLPAAMLENAAGGEAVLNVAQASKPSKPSRNIEKWQNTKDGIYQFYIIQDHTLDETIQFMAQKHGLHARQAHPSAHQPERALTISIVSEPGKQR